MEPPITKNPEIVKKTFKFFGQQLLKEKFILKAIIIKKKHLEIQEIICKNNIRSLVNRIEREIDCNPEMFNKEK